MRCEGGYPSCLNCTKIGESCRYSEQDSTTTRLRNALNRSEQQTENLRRELETLLALDPEECQSKLRMIVGQSTNERVEVSAGGAEQYAPIPRESMNSSPRTVLPASDDALDDGRDEEVC